MPLGGIVRRYDVWIILCEGNVRMSVEEMQYGKPKVKGIIYIVGLTAALAGLLFGLDVGVISGVLPWLEKDWQVDTVTKEKIVSILLVGAFFGSIGAGFISRKFGRKKTLLLSAVIFALGAVFSGLATTPLVMEVVRFFLGLAIGIASFTAPLYLSESSPQAVRGAMISMYQLMITIGILAAFVSDTLLGYGGHWRLMLGIIAVPAVLMFIGILFLPESPRWLLLMGKKEEAEAVLARLRSSKEEVDNEVAEIQEALDEDSPESGWGLLKNSNFRRAVVLGMVLQLFQQFTGINVVMYYAPTIFKEAGFASDTQQMWGTVLVGLINVLSTFIAIAFVDRFGRKPILYAGCIVMALAMGAVGGVFNIGVETSANMPYIAMGSLLLFIVGFAFSAGPLVWVVCSEIFPLAGRDVGITISTATNWLCNAVVGATFLTLLEVLGGDKTFWMFGGLNVLFLIVVFFFCPETKGKSLEEIEENLMAGKKLCNIGN